MSLDELKQRIKEEIPISSVIGNYLSIKRSGSSMISLCPFHVDSKPSMHINDSKKIFKCFACDAAGDAITFVMKHRHLEFVDALKEICQKQGINFDSYQEEKKSNPRIEMAKKILTKASQLYRKTATTLSESPYTDFIKKRGLNEEIATTYSLGYAQNRNALHDYLKTIPNEKDRTFALSIAFELGLLKKDLKNPESHYDTFRDRIMFPIWDQFGQVIGFTSRATREDQKAKYMNSVDSFLFNKRNILYGFHLAKNAIREKDAVILVEGNMDQVALYHHGFKHTVAIMGVALGDTSLERLLSLTKNIYLALDTDQAGFNAMERINRQFAEKGITPKYLEFSPEKDPDDYLKVHGALMFQEKLEKAVPAFDVLLEKLVPEKIPEVLDRKLEILHKAFEILAPLRGDLSATERVVSFAKRLGLRSEPQQIVGNYQDYLAKINEKPKYNTSKLEVRSPEILDEVENHASDQPIDKLEDLPELEEKPTPLLKAERMILQELVQNPALLNYEKVNEILDLVSSDEVKKYIGKIRRVVMEVDDREYESVVSNLTANPEYSIELKESVSSALYNYRAKDPDEKTKLKMIHDWKIKLLTEKLKSEKELLKKEQLECIEEQEMTRILMRLSEVEKSIQQLKKTKPELK